MPDFEGYGLMWMARTPLSTAYGMEGAFNDVTLSLSASANSEDVIDLLDELLAKYGGLGAIARKDQLSHRYLTEEFRGLELMATMFPIMFLAVAVFLLNVVVSRLLTLQREQVAILKAFGYSNTAVVVHYLKLILLIVLFGLILGVIVGIWLGKGMGNMYMEYYRFPFFRYELRPNCGTDGGAAERSRGDTRHRLCSGPGPLCCPPAQAMQPAPPPRYRPSFVSNAWE